MKVRIGDLTKIRTGKLDANAASMDGQYPFFTCSKEPLRISTYSYDCECVLVAGNGDLNVKYYNGKFDAYQRTYIIENNNVEKLYLPYLYYFLETYIEELRKQAIGGVIKYIKICNLSDAVIELPSIEKQKKIVKILKSSKKCLDMRNTQMAFLDGLIKARFVEMFGDAVANPKKWPVKKLKDLSVQINSGNTPKGGSENYVKEGIAFFRSQNVWKNRLEMEDIAYIDAKTHANMKRSSLRCVFSTYQTMIGCVDSASDKDGRIFTCGHFDLIICDEAHRSIYNKYKDIFTYFDAPLVGLTATPKDEVDKNTYDIFELANGVPTYGYDLAQAVEDEYLVDYMTIESKVKFLDEGIVYEELSDADKEEYEKTFVTESGDVPDKIESAALNSWLFNKDTIRKVLRVFMDKGIKIDYGQKIGKTIIFAKNHTHAEKIFEVFNEEYPHLVGYAEVIDNQTKFAQKAIDDFSDPKKLPQIAISVDMLDTGIDVPEILNLVFFKKVMSKAKFWQMIGRGTRLCEGLLDGKDKKLFYIFDFCSNFEFFRVKKKGKEAVNVMPIQGAIFQRRFEIAYKLQSLTDRDDRVNFFLEKLISDMSSEVQRLSRDNRDNFIVKQHLRYLDKYSDEVNYQNITFPDVNVVKEEVSPYIMADGDEPSALRFDALIYGLELAHVAGKNDERAKRDLIKRANALSRLIGKHIDEIDCRKEIIDKVLSDSYVDGAGIIEFEEIRTGLRDIMSFIKSTVQTYDTNFDDDILSTDWHESELENDDLKNYKAKAEFYIKQHQDNIVIAKLKTNKPLTTGDVKALEDILWNEIGTRKDYEGEIGDKPLGEFVREIVGLDMNAAKEAFSEYLNETNYDSRQIYFVNQIVEYVVHNGMIKDMSVLMESPFTDRGSITDIFNASVWMGIKKVIDQINANANVA